MTDVELRRNNLNQTSDERLFNLYEKCDQFEFEPFGIADYNRSDFEMDVDPKNFFYNDVITCCKYIARQLHAANYAYSQNKVESKWRSLLK